MIDYENKQEGLSFGDVVRYEMGIGEYHKWHYFIYVNQDNDYYTLTDGKGHFEYQPIVFPLERIGSVIDKNIIDLMPKGESL